MLIQELRLNQFRNYTNKTFDFNRRLNIIVGNNGVGKTNILESLYFLSNTKSFRTSDDKKLIQQGNTYCAIEAVSEQGSIKAMINERGKTFYINNKIQKKTSDVIGKLHAIIFKPGDIELFSDSPKARRTEIDLELGKISRTYLQAIVNYNHYLKQKNNLLKEKEVDMNLLSVLNDSLIPVITTIIKEREDFIKNINNYISPIYKEMSGTNSEVKIFYEKCSDLDDVSINLELAKEKDMIMQHSTFGPHKDDYTFLIDGKKIGDFASQGQKRMIIISLKLAIAKYVKITTDNDALILLDDVLSELDKTRSEKLINMLPYNQIIITTTHIDQLNIQKNYRLIELEEHDA